MSPVEDDALLSLLVIETSATGVKTSLSAAYTGVRSVLPSIAEALTTKSSIPLAEEQT
jgi:hypothetical protein